ncbi:MAG: glutathione S-transferase family protein [Candidatus Binatus sp.]
MITIYQYIPGWNVPCISPFVTKTIYYMRMAGIPHEVKRQDLSRLQQDAPYGKLPFIDDNGVKVADSTAIIDYLRKYADLDSDATATERAQMLAWNRMIDEHTYWCAVIQPRWREEANWEIYLPIIFGASPVPPEVRQTLEEFRKLILSEFLGHGVGRLPDNVVYERARADIDAISDFLDSKPYFMGEKLRSIDANLLSMLDHIIYTPFKFDTKDYALGKKNLVDYSQRMNKRFGKPEAR